MVPFVDSVNHGNIKMTLLSLNNVRPLNPPQSPFGKGGSSDFPPFLKGSERSENRIGLGGIFFVLNNLQSSILNLQSFIAGH
jgi:hypothetical protein